MKSLKIFQCIFTELKKKKPKIYMDSQKTPIIKVVLKEKNKAEGNTMCDFKTYNKVIVKN